MTQNVSNAIASELASLREKKGAIGMEDLRAILESIAGSMQAGTSPAESYLHNEILAIATHIETTRKEIAALAPDTGDSKAMGGAAEQLDAILKSTEQAAHDIMDAADAIQEIIGKAAVDPVTREKIIAATARIYEGCNFQDLTGQRIKKVMQALQFTEERVRRLSGIFSTDGAVDRERLRHAAAKSGDGALLGGPQLPGDAPSQSDIDALFKSL